MPFMATRLPTKPFSHPTTILTILSLLILTVLILCLIFDSTKNLFFTLEIDSHILVRNYFWNKLISSNLTSNFTSSKRIEGKFWMNQTALIEVEFIPKFDKYISCTFRACSGIGNQVIFQRIRQSSRFASDNLISFSVSIKRRQIFWFPNTPKSGTTYFGSFWILKKPQSKFTDVPFCEPLFHRSLL